MLHFDVTCLIPSGGRYAGQAIAKVNYYSSSGESVATSDKLILNREPCCYKQGIPQTLLHTFASLLPGCKLLKGQSTVPTQTNGLFLSEAELGVRY